MKYIHSMIVLLLLLFFNSRASITQGEQLLGVVLAGGGVYLLTQPNDTAKRKPFSSRLKNVILIPTLIGSGFVMATGQRIATVKLGQKKWQSLRKTLEENEQLRAWYKKLTGQD